MGKKGRRKAAIDLSAGIPRDVTAVPTPMLVDVLDHLAGPKVPGEAETTYESRVDVRIAYAYERWQRELKRLCHQAAVKKEHVDIPWLKKKR